MEQKVGDIICAIFNPKNQWEIIGLEQDQVTIKSLLTEKVIRYTKGEMIILDPFDDGTEYDWDKGIKYPPKFNKEIANIDDLMDLAAHYKLLF